MLFTVVFFFFDGLDDSEVHVVVLFFDLIQVLVSFMHGGASSNGTCTAVISG